MLIVIIPTWSTAVFRTLGKMSKKNTWASLNTYGIFWKQTWAELEKIWTQVRQKILSVFISFFLH